MAGLRGPQRRGMMTRKRERWAMAPKSATSMSPLMVAAVMRGSVGSVGDSNVAAISWVMGVCCWRRVWRPFGSSQPVWVAGCSWKRGSQAECWGMR